MPVIDYYNGFAERYDPMSVKYHWYSPQIMFGLLFDLLPDDPTILDVGIGTGLSSSQFKKIGAKIVGIDGSKEMLRRCREKYIAVDLFCLDIEKEPFPVFKEPFDIVISNGVFYFFHDIVKPFLKCAQLVRSGGYLSINFESTQRNVYEAYENYSHSYIEENPVGKTGVITYRHHPSLFDRVARAAGMKELRRAKYYAYTSPQTGEEIFFTIAVWQKR